ncbi:MAG: hypothetical protein FJ308_02930 [Planctomycetes bacterium]|nr:hypothetical protein [Planctomycetota bacterium]
MQSLPSVEGKIESSGSSLVSQVRAILKRSYASTSLQDAGCQLMEGLRCLVDAEHAVLLRTISPNRLRTTHDSSSRSIAEFVAISGTNVPKPSMDALQPWLELASKVLDASSEEERSKFLNEHAEKIGIGSTIAIPIFPSQTAMTHGPIAHERHRLTSDADSTPQKVQPLGLIVVEWDKRERFEAYQGALHSAVLWIVDASEVWLSKPSRTWNQCLGKHRWKWLVGLVGLAALFQPIELWVELDGSLQPQSQRILYAPTDGFVAAFSGRDGQSVNAGNLVARIASPDLQLQRLQLESEKRIIAEKRSSVEVTINEISNRDDAAALMRARLAGELDELVKRQESIDQQLLWLDGEERRLELRAAADGVFVCDPDWHDSEDRPVRRGDLMARIFPKVGNWQLTSSVMDWDAGYVLQAWHRVDPKQERVKVEFVLASEPGVHKTGVIESIDHAFRNDWTGPALDARIQPIDALVDPRIGATAKVRVPCGRYSRWFVWFRPILDAMYRRFWL